MAFELRNNTSAVVHQIEALQKVLEELKKHEDELDELTTKCWQHAIRVTVNHHVRPNSTLVETHGMQMRVFHKSDIKWELVLGRVGIFAVEKTVAEQKS